MKKILKTVPYIIIAILVGLTVSYAGNLTPPGAPASTMYSLTDIYNLALGTPTTEHSGTISATPGTIASTGKTLTEVYNAVSSHLGVSLANMWNGTCHNSVDNNSICPLGTEFPGGSQALEGVDDFNGYNLGGPRPPDSYATTWVSCASGDHCGTNDAGAAMKDTATGVIWSYPCAGGTDCTSWDTVTDPTTLASNCLPNGNCDYYNTDTYLPWYIANNCTESSGSVCTKKVSSKTGCEANAGWSLPGQKQLMQSYIDGAYGNLEPQGVGRGYWSSTTGSNGGTGAWYVFLSNGDSFNNNKTSTSNVRCVRE